MVSKHVTANKHARFGIKSIYLNTVINAIIIITSKNNTFYEREVRIIAAVSYIY